MIFDIFSKKKSKLNIKKSKQARIIVDIHEKNSLVLANLQQSEADIEIKSLKVGDYIISNTLIERKTTSDFVSSMISKRLIIQLREMQPYKNKILILEGEISENINFNINAIRGMILSISLDFNIPIIQTKNSEDTAKFLLVLAKKQNQEKELSLHSRKGLTKKQQIQYILESFQGIGPATAKKLLKKYKNLKNIFNLAQEELQKELGKKSQAFNILDESY
ncbi:hypothetical protein FJZ17_00220 [Candidatus Pacearchaeota archaeon]|nr:hypothetical protein [Candidatus Pacearchaeota archaeon]